MWKVHCHPRLVGGSEVRPSRNDGVSALRSMVCKEVGCQGQRLWEIFSLRAQTALGEGLSQKGCSCLSFPFVDNNMPKTRLCGYATDFLSAISNTHQLRPWPCFFSHTIEPNSLSSADLKSPLKAIAFKKTHNTCLLVTITRTQLSF